MERRCIKKKTVINNSKLKGVDTSEGGDFIKLDEEHKEETEKEHGAYDPHYGLV